MAKKKPPSVSHVRDNLRRAVEESGLTQEEIGVRMGYTRSGARQAVSRLLNNDAGNDPRLSTLLAFADAIGRPLKDII